jgi:hypothetical protein
VSLTARRAAAAVIAAIGTLAMAASSPAAGFRFTHMVSLKLTVSDHWTRTQDSGCGPVGTGSATWTETWRHPVKAAPELDPAAGRWVLLVPGPGGHSVLDLSAQKAAGTITYANQLSIGGDTGCTGSVDTRGCRTYKIGGTTNVFGIDRRSLALLSAVHVGDQISPPRSCVTGDYTSLDDPDFFKRRLSIRMPSPGLVRTRRTLVLTGSDTGHVSGPAFNLGGNIDETVTQTAVLTLTRIGR